MKLEWRVAVALSAFVASAGEAQAGRTFALTFGIPVGVGLLWDTDGGPALRTDFLVTRSSGETIGGRTGKSWMAQGGLSALFPLVRIDSVRGYFVPRFSYRQTGSSGSSVAQSKTYGVDGGFGVQHDLSRRLSVYGETGLRYSRVTQRTMGITGDMIPAGNSSSWSTYGGVGLMLYLR